MPMEFFETVTTRRSVRRYKPDPVPNELINKLIDAARWAPTGGNLQSWLFYVIKNKQMINDIVNTTYIGFDKVTGRPQKWIGSAPVIIVIGADTKQHKARYGRMGSERGTIFEIGACIENILLGATALGLGSCWVVGFDETELAQLVKLPKGVKLLSLVTIGYPQKVPSPPPRFSVEEITTYLE